jgi:hypothetical protein
MAISDRAGLVQAAWLFTRGDQSVRIVRVRLPGSDACRLLIDGPGPSRHVEEFADSLTCAWHQSELERRFVAAGYRLDGFRDDRRATQGPPAGVPERRRPR